jgi:hypothetical protein
VANYVEIANQAAARIGTEARITSPDDDRVFARAVRAVWDLQRRATIRDGSFNFAMRRAELASEVLPDGVPYPWAASFPLPSDCLRLIEVLNVASRDDYQLEGQAILADSAGPMIIRYCRDVAEPALWDELFAEAFACRLAWKLGRKIAGSNYSDDQGWAEYKLAIAATKRVDALENPPIEQEESDWLLARIGGGKLDGFGNANRDPLKWG